MYMHVIYIYIYTCRRQVRYRAHPHTYGTFISQKSKKNGDDKNINIDNANGDDKLTKQSQRTSGANKNTFGWRAAALFIHVAANHTPALSCYHEHYS